MSSTEISLPEGLKVFDLGLAECHSSHTKISTHCKSFTKKKKKKKKNI